jgi:hypothetical protein
MRRQPISSDPIDAFLSRWDGTEQAERANYVAFLNELCHILDVPLPDPASGGGGNYRYERSVVHHAPEGAATTRRIDLYRRDHFIIEAKQGANADRQTSLFTATAETERRSNVRRSRGWGQAMVAAKGQAEGYVRDLPTNEKSPPFLIVCDVGFCFDLYADFSGTGRHYAQYPDREGFRIYLQDLRDPAKRELLRRIWEEPHSLDPALQRVAVTRDIAALLAKLAVALEGPKDQPRHPPQAVATFLMRCIFCMFSQSVGLLPSKDSFTDLLEVCRDNPPSFVGLVGDLWRQMNAGGFSPALRASVRRFNGGLFAAGPHGPAEPLPVDADMLNLLIQAAHRDWTDVEPAIFGTLLENALDDRQRGELGAHFTPRSFVERLVLPTVMEPLRAEWDGAKAGAYEQEERGDRPAAAAIVRAFHARLCAIRVLDPACGTGNFLYVTMELMKRLEGEVLDLLASLDPGEGDRLDLTGASVDPHQFLGLEKNPRAVPVAELVLWIGWLQWHFRTRGNTPPAEPILRDFRNIREADALLTYAREEPERDRKGDPVSRWGGRTMLHPITGEAVPDPSDQVLVIRPVGAKPTVWPDADFIVGNPPFIAGQDLRDELGSGYAEVLWKTNPDVPKSADLALHFWWRAAQYLKPAKPETGKKSRSKPTARTQRFGFITSNSLRQVFCRRVVAAAMEGPAPLHLVFAIADHPWTDGTGSAAVRIAMTVAASGDGSGKLSTVLQECVAADGVPEVTFATRTGRINADLTIGTNVREATPLQAMERLASMGVKLHGEGFIVSRALARQLGLGVLPGVELVIRPFINGRDVNQRARDVMVIDLFGLNENAVRKRFPNIYQHVLLAVKPKRDQNNRVTYRENWWTFGEPRADFRPALSGLRRYIGTAYTAKHRIFSFHDAAVVPESMVIAIASDEAYVLGVLQSRQHLAFALEAGGTLEDRPRYNKTQCFDPFPFPAATSAQAAAIGAIAEELDAHRKVRMAAHSHLTLTMLYNTLERVRSGTQLTDAERDVHDAGQVSVLRHLHDRLDEAVAAAYGWPADLSDAEMVARVVALNAQRRAEEAEGTVRWLRPEFQAPEEIRRVAVQPALSIDDAAIPDAIRWPQGDPAGQYIVLRSALVRVGTAATPSDLARHVAGAPRGAKIGEMLRVLTALGQARDAGNNRYAA